MDAVGQILDELSHQPVADQAALRKLKRAVSRRTGGGLVRNDALISRYRAEVSDGRRAANPVLEQALTLNAIRSSSGIATVTVITEPYPCPGRCVYCPTEARAPKSYLVNEPAVLRALRSDYDPYRQVITRLRTLDDTGHPTGKVELIVKGGTWSFYPDAYQRWFIRRCFDAMNDFVPGAGAQLEALPIQPLDAHADQVTPLPEAQRANETATTRMIGLTIETRPDYVNDLEMRRLRECGVTRVEMGVQSLNDAVLDLIVRDHGTEAIREATRALRNAGFKVAHHLMPNLPGATPDDDRATMRALFEDPAYRPDTLKIYPCVVVETAELYQWWKDGRYTPYDDETLVELLIELKTMIPPYARIERVIRDIPATSIEAGCKFTNLREEVQRRMAARGLRCRCVRCREVRGQSDGPFELVRRDYEAGGGQEIFLSFEDVARDRLAALLRLRLPSATHPWPALADAALIRELHTYGRHVPIHGRAEEAVQHRGFGRRLVAEAELLASESGLRRMAVISGVGAREYYRKLGYHLQETYMVKELP